jgi:hypothetical protein
MFSEFDFSKMLFYAVSIMTVLGVLFAFGLYSGAKRTVVYRAVKKVETAVMDSIVYFRPDGFLQPARYEGAGVTVNDAHDREEQLIFLSGFFENTNELRLIRRNGDVVARWPVQFSKIFPSPTHLHKAPTTDWHVDTHGALILPDGSVVFNFEHSGLVKLDRCGGVVWTLARMSHHSVEPAEDGGFWVPGRRYYPKDINSPLPPFDTPLLEDTLMRVSEDGKVIEELSVPKLIFDNGLEALLTEAEIVDLDNGKEIVHLNKIEELTTDLAGDFPMFDVGDLMISLRESNLVMVINPDTGKVKWWQIGPWIWQHDPEFVPGGKIIVFNNNPFVLDRHKSEVPLPRFSNIVEIDPASHGYRVAYGNKPGQEMHTTLRGKVQRTSTGGLFITEFEGGRIFETDAEGHVIWEYINRYSPDKVAEVTEARIYSANYFSVPDWTCERISE